MTEPRSAVDKKRGPYIIAALLLLSACSVRDALPEGAEGMKCIHGHDEVVGSADDATQEREFVCDEWVRETP